MSIKLQNIFSRFKKLYSVVFDFTNFPLNYLFAGEVDFQTKLDCHPEFI